jgi:hypothetical protein
MRAMTTSASQVIQWKQLTNLAFKIWLDFIEKKRHQDRQAFDLARQSQGSSRGGRAKNITGRGESEIMDLLILSKIMDFRPALLLKSIISDTIN